MQHMGIIMRKGKNFHGKLLQPETKVPEVYDLISDSDTNM